MQHAHDAFDRLAGLDQHFIFGSIFRRAEHRMERATHFLADALQRLGRLEQLLDAFAIDIAVQTPANQRRHDTVGLKLRETRGRHPAQPDILALLQLTEIDH
ncbi:hypothetical protein CWB62_18640, partial [Pseudoalteromonas sp. S408]